MDKTLRTLLSGLTVIILTLATMPSAEALSIKLSSGASTTITDDGAGDIDGTDGSIAAVGLVIGAWTVSVASGLSDPVIGSATSPSMQVTFIATASGTPAIPLTVLLSDDFFGPSGTAVRADFGGTTLGVVTYNTWKGAGNAEFSLGTLLTTQSATNPPFAFSGSANGSLTTGAFPYSLTQEVIVTRSSTVTANLSVPDGGSTAALLGSALFAFGMLRRRFGKS